MGSLHLQVMVATPSLSPRDEMLMDSSPYRHRNGRGGHQAMASLFRGAHP